MLYRDNVEQSNEQAVLAIIRACAPIQRRRLVAIAMDAAGLREGGARSALATIKKARLIIQNSDDHLILSREGRTLIDRLLPVSPASRDVLLSFGVDADPVEDTTPPSHITSLPEHLAVAQVASTNLIWDEDVLTEQAAHRVGLDDAAVAAVLDSLAANLLVVRQGGNVIRLTGLGIKWVAANKPTSAAPSILVKLPVRIVRRLERAQAQTTPDRPREVRPRRPRIQTHQSRVSAARTTRQILELASTGCACRRRAVERVAADILDTDLWEVSGHVNDLLRSDMLVSRGPGLIEITAKAQQLLDNSPNFNTPEAVLDLIDTVEDDDECMLDRVVTRAIALVRPVTSQAA